MNEKIQEIDIQIERYENKIEGVMKSIQDGVSRDKKYIIKYVKEDIDTLEDYMNKIYELEKQKARILDMLNQ
ncbi:MAG: hypothetical protein ACRCTZ_20280 [Sarcina sp.]